MRVYIEGRLQYREWQDQNGVKRNVTDVIANDIQMLESLGARADTGEQEPPPEIKVPEDLDQPEDDSVPF